MKRKAIKATVFIDSDGKVWTEAKVSLEMLKNYLTEEDVNNIHRLLDERIADFTKYFAQIITERILRNEIV